MTIYEYQAVMSQKGWDAETALFPDYVELRTKLQLACPHEKVFAESGLCAQCGAWTKGL